MTGSLYTAVHTVKGSSTTGAQSCINCQSVCMWKCVLCQVIVQTNTAWVHASYNILIHHQPGSFLDLSRLFFFFNHCWGFIQLAIRQDNETLLKSSCINGLLTIRLSGPLHHMLSTYWSRLDQVTLNSTLATMLSLGCWRLPMIHWVP